MNNNYVGLRARVLAREWLGGTFVNLGSALTAEIAALSGFDWVMLDHEHGPGGEETLLHQLQAVSGTAASAIVRIAANEAPRFKRVLDLGVDGVMVPYVNNADDARRAVASSRYPPLGIRGVSKFNRAAGFGRDFPGYYSANHQGLVVIAQIETPEALSELDSIAAVEGIDGLFLGPLDLSANLGIPSQFLHPDYLEARQRVADVARQRGKAAGIFLSDADSLEDVRKEGYTLVALGSDGGALSTGLQYNAGALRALVGSHSSV